jgi:hypothetical protein
MIPAECKYPVHEQELLAIVRSIQHWRHYLEGCAHFLVVTDHSTIKHFMTQPQASRRQAGWIEILSPYANNMDIFYKKGAENMADGLSRRPDLKRYVEQWEEYELNSDNAKMEELYAITLEVSPGAEFISSIRTAYAADPRYSGPTPPVGCVLDESGIYRLDGRVCVPNNSALRGQLLRHYHDELGHYGTYRMLAHLKESYFWPKMSFSVQNHVSTCPQCQLVKATTQKRSGLMSPLPVPSRP